MRSFLVQELWCLIIVWYMLYSTWHNRTKAAVVSFEELAKRTQPEVKAYIENLKRDLRFMTFNSASWLVIALVVMTNFVVGL